MHLRALLLSCLGILVLAAFAGPVSALTLLPQVAPPVLSLDTPPGSDVAPVLRIYGDDSSDLLGGGSSDAIAFGDVNGDGYADQIIGAALADTPGTTDFSGEVVVIYGKSTWFGWVDLNTNGVPGLHGETRLLGAQAGDFLGAAVASGDIDGDGFDDIVMGAIGGGDAGIGAGEVVIIYGNAFLPGQALNVGSVPDATIILGDDQQSGTGYSLATADVDGDGYDDVIIGAPGNFFFSTHAGGSVYVIYGGPTLRGATINLDTNGVTTAFSETRIFGDNPGEALGHSVAAGDIDGDGYQDVVIGAPGADPFLSLDRGVAYVVYGGPGLRGATIGLNSNDGISAAGETRVLGIGGNARLGESVAVGDVNGDGRDDLVLGSPYAAPDGAQTGEVYIIPGKQSLRASHVLLSAPIGTYDETRITGEEEWSRLGESLGVGDVDGDGLDDVVIGATGAVPLGLNASPAIEDGVVFVFQGLALPPGVMLNDPRAVASLIITADDSNDRIGTSVVAGGDMNFDGVPELAFGTVSGNSPFLAAASNRAGWTTTLFGGVISDIAVREERIAPGDAAAMDFGPVLRVSLDHSSGNKSTDIAILGRMAPALPVAGNGFVARVLWLLATNRTSLNAALTFRYTDAETLGGQEGRFIVFTSATGKGGTWKRAGKSQTRDPARNRITVEGVTELGFFCIGQDGFLDERGVQGGVISGFGK